MQEACTQVTQGLATRQRAGLVDLLLQVRVLPERVEVDIDPSVIAQRLGIEVASDISVITLTTSVRLTRTGRVVQLVQDNGCAVTSAPVNEKLLRLVVRARRWWGILLQGDVTIDTLAEQEGVTASWMTRVVRLAFLSPAVVEAILAGTTRAGVDAALLTATDAMKVDWRAQAAMYLVEAA